jgi:hypothetical protein
MTDNNTPRKSSPFRDFAGRLGILGELLLYLWAARLWWMIPMIILLILTAILIFLGSTGSGGSLVYTLF